jgi:EAL domain-containing protein (putative c-di-GMP-specific phosphodiesterase class I)
LVENKYCNEINTIVDTLFNRFREKWEIIDTTYYCTMSMGIAKFPYDGINLFEILKKVDMAMYNAKKQGKNRAMYYKSKIGFDSIRNIELERYLRESVSNSCNGFMVYYQPIVNAKTKEIEGAEALLRWQCEHLGMISPAEFIPLSENLGFIIQLGEFVLKKACMQCKKMIDKGMTDFKISINLSVYQIYEPDFVDKVKEIIESSQVPYSNITFEVTESLAINDFKVTREILQKLSELGVSISLDDFGTGYSSLNNIKEMPLNTIKIDKSFIDDLIHDSSTEVFVKTIIALAHALDMKVCAEGVEEEMQYKRLVDLKTDMIQGFLFGKPISAEEFEEKFIMV